MAEGKAENATDSAFRWYVLRVIGGRERKVAESIRSEASRLKLTDYVRDTLVPVERLYQIRNGKKVSREKVLMPNYVFVEALLVGEVPLFLRELPNVLGFLLRPDGEPSYLDESEVARLQGRADSVQDEYEAMEEPYRVGDQVKVVDGPFNTFSGVVSRVDDERKKLEILVKIFERKTPVELSFMQVEREK